MDELDREDWLAYCYGDNAAFERLYRRHKDHLLTYCVYAGHSREAGEDIVQETFTKLVRQRNGGGELGSVKNWLFICARNLSLNTLKRQSQGSQPAYEPPTGPTISPDIQLFLRNVLNRLEPEQRELILLREYHGFSIAELALITGASEEAIRVRLYRARKRMGELGKEYR